MADPYAGLNVQTAAALERMRREQEGNTPSGQMPTAHTPDQLRDLRYSIEQEIMERDARERALNNPVPMPPTFGQRVGKTLADVLWNTPKQYWGRQLSDLMR